MRDLAFFCFFYNITFSFAFMLIQKLFLLHLSYLFHTLITPRGEGRGGKVGTSNDGLYGLYYPKRGVMKR